MKYLLVNAYSVENRGDAGIVVAMIHLIKEIDSSASIKVMSSHADENRSFYDSYSVDSVSSPWLINNKQSIGLRYLSGVIHVISAIFFKGNRKFKDYSEADIVISVGGGYLYSSRRGPLGVGLLGSLYHIWLGKHFNKPVVAFPQSVGPLHSSLDKYIVKKILNKVDLFFSREEHTTKLLKKMNIPNVVEALDVGFTLPKKDFVNDEQIKKNEGIKKIGITVMDWRFSRIGITEDHMKEYLNKIAAVYEKVHKLEDNVHLYIFPQVTVGKGDTDLTPSLELQSIIGEEKATIIDLAKHEATPEQLVDIYGEMDLFIGSRMHSTIFAVAGNTPTIALSYQPKTTGTFKKINLNNYVLDIQNFSEDELFNMAKEILIQKNYPLEKIQENVNYNKEKLLSNLNILLNRRK